jgi:catalase (peroxidase I)
MVTTIIDDDDEKCYYHGSSPKTPGKVWTASRVDLVLGSNSKLRAICEGYMVVLIVVSIF